MKELVAPGADQRAHTLVRDAWLRVSGCSARSTRTVSTPSTCAVAGRSGPSRRKKQMVWSTASSTAGASARPTACGQYDSAQRSAYKLIGKDGVAVRRRPALTAHQCWLPSTGDAGAVYKWRCMWVELHNMSIFINDERET